MVQHTYCTLLRKRVKMKVETIQVGGLEIKSAEETQEDIQLKIKMSRNILLAECDFTVLPDSPFTDQEREEWKTYRQQLRDLDYTTDPKSVKWPKKPQR